MITAELPVVSSPNGLHLFGQLVIGPPGSGKTTYCAAMRDFLVQLGRKVAVINLDPANDSLPYPCSVDINDLISLGEVMDYMGLGPNGGLIYCMEYLFENRDWLEHRLALLKQNESKIYLIFDLPGQVELYTHNPSMRKLVAYLTGKSSSSVKNTTDTLTTSSDTTISTYYTKCDIPTSGDSGLNLHLTSVHLVDSHYCTDAGKFIACLLTSLSSMLQLAIPHVNVLSKADLVEQFGELAFNLDFFTEVLDLKKLIDRVWDTGDTQWFHHKYARLNAALISLIEDHSLVQFLILDVQNRSHLERIMRYVDRANGYVFGQMEQHNLQALMNFSSGVELQPDWIGVAQENYTSKGQTDELDDIDLFA